MSNDKLNDTIMHYAFINPTHAISPKGGVKVQAEMWKSGLEKLDQHVTLVNPWEPKPWKSFDAIVIFSYASGCRNLVRDLAKENPNIVMAPIIDPNRPDYLYKFFCKYWGAQRHLGLSSRFHDLWLARKYPKLWLVRSEEERHYVNYCLEIPHERIVKVPLHYRIPPIAEIPAKEDFCFHASRLASANKNVPRLIEAAKKYGFLLKLAGHLMGQSERDWLSKLIDNAPNIEYVGEVSEEELQNLYRRAKVFALPSLQEGVGMVALEAAAYGCEIVLTNYGAPKEYYDGRAILVNPHSVDEIGQGVMRALKDGFAQPEMKTYIEQHYSEEACCKMLQESLGKVNILNNL